MITMLSGPIKVLVVEHSPFVRSAVVRELSAQEGIAVVGDAKDAFEARDRIIQHRPDVIILDTALPRVDGLTFLAKLMEHYPVPVIVCADPTTDHRQAALDAIEQGATEVVVKPPVNDRAALQRLAQELALKVRAAAVALRRPPPIPLSATGEPSSLRSLGLDPTRHVVAVGASTGGTDALRHLLSRVPSDFPPVVMVQHMPEGFTALFANRLNDNSPIEVREAVDGDVLTPGLALLARGGIQMTVRGRVGHCRIAYGDREEVNRHCPSVDVLFQSVARCIGRAAVGVLLTGMGADGAEGLLAMHNAGAVTIGQNRGSCVVYGMPKVAADLGAVQMTAAPPEIPQRVVEALRARSAAGSAARG
jgi:two-component system chemotaxis response regulator CheB